MNLFGENQNIFNAKYRTQEDALKSAERYLSMNEEEVQKKLSKEKKEKQEQFTRQMQKHYAVFDHKINKCKLSCAQNSKNYNEHLTCYGNCEKGMKSFAEFVDNKINVMHQSLNECVSHANQLPNSLYEIYRCYHLYNRGFSHLEDIIKSESLYYE